MSTALLCAALTGAVLGAVGCLGLPALLRWLGLERTNFSGNPIGTGAGLLLVGAGVVSALAAGWILPAAKPLLPLAALCGYGLLGFLDDRWGTAEFKGLRGHVRALRQGKLTTGFVKASGGLLLGFGVAWGVRPGWQALGLGPLIALCANLLNLLDLRPLRTLKGFWLLSLPLLPWASPVLAGVLGASLPYARLEASRRVMLGDTGSNSLGGVVGVSLAAALPFPAAMGFLALVVAFHVWAERHSLSGWIDRHPWARRVDDLGWRSISPPEAKRAE